MSKCYVTLPRGLFLLVALLAANGLPTRVLAQERVGVVAGTWEACEQGTQPLRRRLASAEGDAKTPPQWLRYLRFRLVVELDRCMQKASAPLAVVLDIARRYEDLGVDTRALDIGLRAISTFGDTPESDLVVGRLFYKRGQLQRAVQYLEKVVEARPTDVDAAQLLAVYYYGQGDPARAVRHLRVVAESRPDQFEANAALGDACLKTGDLACASEYLGQASRLRGEDVLLAVKVGDLELARKRWAHAIEAYERAVSKAQRADAYLGLGRASRALGQLDNAEAAFYKAMTLGGPAELTSALELSRTRRSNGRPLPSSIEPYARAENAPPEAVAEYLLSLLAWGDAETAATIVRSSGKSLQADPRLAAVAGDAVLAAGSGREALMYYRAARAQRPESPVFGVREARALRTLSKYAEATALLKELPVEDAVVRAELVGTLVDAARAQAAADDLTGALDSLAEAARLLPDDASVALARATLLAANGRGDEAAAALKPTSKTEARLLAEAWVAFASGRFSEAAGLLDGIGKSRKSDAASLLWAASLAKAGRGAEAGLVLREGAARAPAAVRTSWLGFADATAAKAELQQGHYAEAAKHARKESPGDASVAASLWLSRIPVLAAAEAGNLSASGPDFVSYVQTLKRKGAPPEEDIDKVLLALGDLGKGDPQAAADRLRPVRAAVAQELRARARLDLAVRAFQSRQSKLASSLADSLASVQGLPPEAALNIAVLRYASAGPKLVESLRSFVDAGMPVALFDLALALDGSAREGSASIEPLSKMLAAAPPSSLRTRAEALIELKRRLY